MHAENAVIGAAICEATIIDGKLESMRNALVAALAALILSPMPAAAHGEAASSFSLVVHVVMSCSAGNEQAARRNGRDGVLVDVKCAGTNPGKPTQIEIGGKAANFDAQPFVQVFVPDARLGDPVTFTY